MLIPFNKRSVSSVIIDLIIINAALMIFLSYYMSKEVTRYFLFAVMLLPFFPYLIDLYNNAFKFNRILFFTICIVMFHCLYVVRNVPNLIMFSTALMFIYYLQKHGLDKQNIWLLFLSSVVLSLQATINLTDKSTYYSFMHFEQADKIFRLAFQNPNMAGIVLSNLAIIMIVSIFFFKNPWLKFCMLGIAILVVSLTVLTNNRGSIGTLLIFVLLLLIYRKGNSFPNFTKYVLLFSPFLIIIASIIMFKLLPRDLVFLNKPFFSGRELLWQYTIETIISKPFLIRSYAVGSLNIVFNGIYVYGFFGMIGYFAYLGSLKFIHPHDKALSYQQVAYMGFFSLFFQQSFEATLIFGSFAIYILSYLLIGVANSKIDD